MRNCIRVEMEIPEETMGIDLGDRWSHYCIVEREGKVVEEGRVPTRRQAMEKFFGTYGPLRVVMESSTHSRWMKEVAERKGHEVVVSNPRRVRLISSSGQKGDRLDAEFLARLGRVDPKLLFAIRHRGEEAQADLAVLKARDELVQARTQLINHVRGRVKSFGERLPSCSTESFHRQVPALIPKRLGRALDPLLEMIQQLNQQIRHYDEQIKQLCEKYSETEILRQVKGVGPILSLAYVLTLEEGGRFGRSRVVGAYFGLTPRQDQSGARDPQLRITKQGDAFVRKLLINAGHYIVGPFGEDCDLRRHGEKIAARGGKNAKKRAVVAVARKLSVLLHHLWMSGEVYDPLYQHPKETRRVA